MNNEQLAYLEQLCDDKTNDRSDVYVSFTIRYGVEDDDVFDEMMEYLKRVKN